MIQQFVTAYNGARTYYELSVALQEMGLLRCHVGDFYCPDFLSKIPGLPDKIRHRHRRGLSSRRVHIDFRAAIKQHLFSVGNGPDPHFEIDRSLSLTAAKIASKTESHLFLHNQYAYWAFRALPDRKRYMYQFHPHAASVIQLLESDYALHPEVRWSFENEFNSQPLDRQRAEALQEWQMADGIVCASSFTKSSLVQQGCRAEIINVVPYGVFFNVNEDSAFSEKSDVCRFIFVGLGIQRKGLHHLLKAWKHAAMKSAELIVVARSLDPGIQPLLDQPNVRFYPDVSDQMLKRFYREDAIFVMPSLVEGFGKVYLEALAAGLYCIGTANTGLPDLRLPSDCTSIVPVGNIQKLAETLAALADNFRRGEIDRAKIRQSVHALTWDRHRAELRSAIAKMVG